MNAHLVLDSAVKNPDNLGVQIVVKTITYTIYSVENPRLSRSTGLSFEELNLPEEVLAIRNDKGEETLGVTWSDTKYDNSKIGMQLVQGTLNTPLPAHLKNPNNRQPKVFLTLSAPNTQILSLTPITVNQMEMATAFAAEIEDQEEILGVVEYRFWAEVQHEDGTITIEPYSIFEEVDIGSN